MRSLVIFLSAALALAGAALAQDGAASPPAASAGATAEAAVPATEPASGQAAEDEGDGKVVCKRIVQTGSRLNSERICMTIREWKLQTEDARSTARDYEAKSGPGGMNPNGATTGASR